MWLLEGGVTTYGQPPSGVGQAWDLPYLTGPPESQFLHLSMGSGRHVPKVVKDWEDQMHGRSEVFCKWCCWYNILYPFSQQVIFESSEFQHLMPSRPQHIPSLRSGICI